VHADYKSLPELMEALKKCGVLEDLEITIGIDATGSNQVTGEKSFGGLSLHETDEKLTGGRENPYVQVMKVATKFLARDLNGSVPLYFFGSEQANKVGGCVGIKDCKGQADLIATYRSTIKEQTLSGPTSFIPLIRETMRRCRETKKFHLVLIITDGAVHDEKDHYAVLNEASHLPMAVVCAGVGDGPWDAMERFDDNIPAGRVFDNFQFVRYANVVKKEEQTKMEEEFFFHAFMEVPAVYESCKSKLGYKQGGGYQDRL